MAREPLSAVLRHLHRLTSAQGGGSIADAQLLDRFVLGRDEAAFELLVRRHGGMVLAVCRRVIRDAHEAEDAFQAAWLTLARKAGAISKRESVASWLYKVAYRISLRARAASSARIHLAGEMMKRSARSYEPACDAGWSELRPLLDEELNRLPEKYRAPVVLCYLEGKTNEEAAQQLQWPVGTVKTRLTRARLLLADRLTHRGLALSGSLLATVFSEHAMSASLPALLVGPTVRGALDFAQVSAAAGAASARVVALTQGVLKTMLFSKLKMATMIIMALSIAGAGAGALTYSSQAAQSGPTPAAGAPQAPRQTRTNFEQEQIAAELNLSALKLRLLAAETSLEEANLAVQKARAAVHSQEQKVERMNEKTRQGGGLLPKLDQANPKQPENEAVAYIFNKPITRAELGEYLLDRLGADRLKNLINQRIIEESCRRQGIEVTQEEVEIALQADLESLKLSREAFTQRVLDPRKQSLYEWKQDVIRPRLLLTKLCRSRVQVSEEDLRRAFEARYGERIHCSITFHPGKGSEKARVYESIRAGEANIDELVRQPPARDLTHAFNRLEPIGRYSTDNEEFEKLLFRLQPGQESWCKTPEGSALIRCIRRIPADESVKLEDVRATLTQEVLDKKIQAEIPKCFEELRKRAQPRVVLPK